MIFDLHNDFPTALCDKDYFGYADSIGDNTVTAAIWTSELSGDVIKTVGEISARVRELDRICLPIAVEDIGFLYKDGKYLDFDFSVFSYCSLTWNYDNGFAGGALDNGTLTYAGKRVVKIINDCGCAVDLAHLNRASFYPVLDCSRRALCSHTGFNGHLRSLDDNQIRTLVNRNVVIGLCTVSSFTDAHNLEQFADVIDRFVQKYGVDNLAIGSDFNGSNDIPKDISDYNGLNQVKDKLLRRGYTTGDLHKIFYGNAYSFYLKER